MDNVALLELISNFKIEGRILDIRPYGEGHINSTYVIETDKEKYILQKINHYVFKDVNALMHNILVVTSFIKNKGKESLDIIPTNDGSLFYKKDDEYYRIYIFVKNTICYQKVGNSLALAYKSGAAFGELHHLLNDLSPFELEETIPDFHNTPKRYHNFLDALANADKNKIEIAKDEINYIKAQESTYFVITDALKDGQIKNHITHNDTKINNILFDKDTGDFRCVIDLDTVMPGTILYDIGDAFRSMFTGDNEDNVDTSLLKVNLDIYKAFISNYISKMKNELTNEEVKLIPFSIYLMTIECGVRFLEDYLRNNVYFSTQYETHNLIRARTQIALAKDVLFNLDILNKITKDIYKELIK